MKDARFPIATNAGEVKAEGKVKKVNQIRVHVGVQLKNRVLNSVNSVLHKVEMTLHDGVVEIKGDGIHEFIPLANIHQGSYTLE